MSRRCALAGTKRSDKLAGCRAGLPSTPGYRFSAAVTHHVVWLYHPFSLSLRDAELILAERGIVVSHEDIRRWCLSFSADFAARLRKRLDLPKP